MWGVVLVLASLAVTGCYNPQLGECEVTCGSDSPCPASLTCGSDSYCHVSGDTNVCTPPTTTLTVSTQGSGGHVSSSPMGVSCTGSGGSGCMSSFAVGTTITLMAHPFNNDQFMAWTGDECTTDTTTMCVFTIEVPTEVNAVFQ